MSGWRTAGVAALVAIGVVVWARLDLKAQDRQNAAGERNSPERGALGPAGEGRAPSPAVSVLDALERPFILPFGEATRLDEVCKHLRRILDAPVVLDRAALDRQDVRADDTVELELHGVRLKTGLKLLLDQVGLTYKVVPEDNLLIVTDDQGSDDPLARVLAELKALHRDVHDVQDSVEELRTALGIDEGGAKMRKPTIIEEVPEPKDENKPAPTSPQPRPRSG